MRINVVLIIAFAIAASSMRVFAQASVAGDPVLDTRVIYDTSSMGIGQIAAATTQVWVVGTTRAQGSPQSFPTTVVQDPKTGIYHALVSGQPHWSGSLSVVAVLSGKSRQRVWDYVVPLRTSPPRSYGTAFPGDTGLHSPLEDGNTVVCQLHDSGLKDDRQFSPIYEIPAAWRDDVLPAVKRLKEHPDLGGLSASGYSPHRHGLIDFERMSWADNPLFVIAIIRRAAGAGELSAQVLDLAVAHTRGMEQASIVYLALRPLESNYSDCHGVIAKRIELASSGDELWGLALGAFTSEDSGLLGMVDERQASLMDTGPYGKYIDKLIAAAKLREMVQP